MRTYLEIIWKHRVTREAAAIVLEWVAASLAVRLVTPGLDSWHRDVLTLLLMAYWHCRKHLPRG